MNPPIQQSHVTDAVLNFTRTMRALKDGFAPIKAALAEDISQVTNNHDPAAAQRLRSETLPKLQELFDLMETQVVSAENFFLQLPNGTGLLDSSLTTPEITGPLDTHDDNQRVIAERHKSEVEANAQQDAERGNK